jgi:HSP90 family molecular chaperone
MLQQTQQRAVETGGITQSNAFTIKANAKAFKVLIDGLYSDKVKSIVRELWTNAYDSHIMAGTPDKPFTCTLPTRFEPVFSVRDYGVSLRHSSVMGLYTTVFESTKDETNDQVGQLGLGSKSPFAYTDTFSVTSYLDGVKRMYSAYIDASGVPTIALLGEDTTDEPNGLEVSFPAKEEDISAFIRAASSVVLGFDVAPEFKGQVIDVSPPERGIEGTGWYIAKDPGDLPHSGAFARQGCVLYPLSRTVFMFEDDIYYEMLDCPLVIDFEIGQLDISASRESLSYDDRTKKNIENRLSEIKPEMLAVVEEKKKDLKTLFDFKNFSKVFFEEAAYLPPAVKEEVERNLTYKGAKVNTIWPTLYSGRTHGLRKSSRRRGRVISITATSAAP